MANPLAHRHAAPERDAADSADWHELAVANPTFLLERLGSECTDLQGLRELTVNGLDAIAPQGEDSRGRVWDMDGVRFDSSGGRLRKLAVIDTGTGMPPSNCATNQLAASGREQSSTGNFGVGAKVTAGSRNPAGLEYRSRHQGQGSLVCFKRHRDGRWELEPQHWERAHRLLAATERSRQAVALRGQAHGTQVVLLGQHERHDTTRAPESVTEARRQWIMRYLNGRFLRPPQQIELLVRENHGRHEPGPLRQIHGEHWRGRYRAVPGAHAVIEAHVREWCEQVLVEVVLAARNSGWSADQVDVLLSPTSLTAALLPRHLLHATLQKRLGQKLGTPRSGPGGLVPDASSAPRSRRPRGAREKRQESGEQTA